ncbi:GNAT family N-acetyltransferase [Planomonospora sp. ID67723]|uniref:GNAT family N-acetyltransferase n=1 Tax=Planomonospora sp. ID67723 TaxID=2738134 RepID=UPI001E4EFC06|nr:GNAT family N-acetyltransferase [Planomonospora sp. ID67723]
MVRPRRDPVRVLPGDGVEIRPARMDDEERIRSFLEGLSVQTQTLRFFTGVGRPAASMVRALLAVDDRHDALLAVCGDTVVGHAMSFRGDGPGGGAGGVTGGPPGAEGVAVEIAVVVADDWQGRGLGSRLVRRLVRRAVAGGARTLGMDVLGGNRKVLNMIRREWPEAVMKASSGNVEVSTKIGLA